jgi:hypothetical protein
MRERGYGVGHFARRRTHVIKLDNMVDDALEYSAIPLCSSGGLRLKDDVRDV